MNRVRFVPAGRAPWRCVEEELLGRSDAASASSSLSLSSRQACQEVCVCVSYVEVVSSFSSAVRVLIFFKRSI